MLNDKGFASEGIGVQKHNLDQLHYKAEWEIIKYASDEDLALGKPYETVHMDGNLLLNAGINLLLSLLAGGAGTAFNAANAYLGVGDSSTAAVATQTALQAATNKAYQAMDGSYPTYGTSQQIVFQGTYTSGAANFAWNEFGVFNAAAGGGTMFNRLVSSQGTKTAGQAWTLKLTITIS